MSRDAVGTLIQDVLNPAYVQNRQELDRIDCWYRWSPEKVPIPNDADREHKDLRDLSETPWLGLVVTTLAQLLHAERVRSASTRSMDAMWEPWQRNRMHARQHAIHRSALAYGQAFASVLPGDTGAVIRGISPREMTVVYQDPVEDEWPMYTLRKSRSGSKTLYRVMDDEAEYFYSDQNGRIEYVEHRVHDVGVTPIVRYGNMIDLEGRAPGEVEPFISVAKRINKTSYDRLLVQHFNSWKIRTATGMDKPSDEAEGKRLKLLLRQSDILTGEDGVEFGTLDETELGGFIKAWESDIEALAAVSQTPSHNLTGKMINLSAEALAAAESMLERKAGERKTYFGDAHCQALRLAAHIEGRREDAEDFSISMQWADLESRSMAQAADALGKIATMLKVPVEKLWDRIPGVTAEVSKEWAEYAAANPSPEAQLAASLNSQSNGTNG